MVIQTADGNVQESDGGQFPNVDLVVFADIRDAKEGWTMAFSDRLTIPAGGYVNATVLATIPFGHNHGAIHMFEAAFESEDGQQRLVNPGRTVVYAFELSHAGDQDIPVTASITGTNAD